MPKPISAAESAPVRVVLVTLDDHLAGACDRAAVALAKRIPGLTVGFHSAATFAEDPDALDACIADIGRGDIVIVTMMFVDDHVRMILPALKAGASGATPWSA